MNQTQILSDESNFKKLKRKVVIILGTIHILFDRVHSLYLTVDTYKKNIKKKHWHAL